MNVKAKNRAIVALVIIGTLTLAILNVGSFIQCKYYNEADTIRVTDSIRVIEPQVMEITQMHTDTVRLPYVRTLIAHDTINIAHDTINIAHDTIDSVFVAVPIEQAIYKDGTYTAYVSGYKPRLDSILIHPVTLTVREREKARRIHLGIQAGYGITPKGPQPYIGIGITYRIY